MVDLAISMRESGDVLGSDGVLAAKPDNILQRVEQAAHGCVRARCSPIVAACR